jgi:cysteinyl-tRNA synthetase
VADIYLFNSLTRKKEKFIPFDFAQGSPRGLAPRGKPIEVGLYTCGMTVYDYAHIGHGRKYVTDDILKRFLLASGYKVKHVQNVTDVGHLVSDADMGEDKMEKGAKKSGKTVWEVAEFFTKNFYESMDKLNILRPDIICKATDHIKEQIAMVQKLIARGFAYDTPEAVYFDVTKFAKYDGLFGQKLAGKKVAVRGEVKEGEHKKHPVDFTLWFKTVGRFANHAMHWESPWGDGFPGWHLECSAMSIKYLGERFDIHTGGEDHLSVHHPNEIAQSEGATGKSPFVKYWLHTAFLMVDGRKMSKSLDNFYTVEDIIEKGYDPLALRYLYLTAHYRDPLNFTWESLGAAQTALTKLRAMVWAKKNGRVDDLRGKFREALADDLNTPRALAVLWKAIKVNSELALEFDQVLGLNLDKAPTTNNQIPGNIKILILKRENLRKEEKFAEADKIRRELLALGYKLGDEPVHAKK